MRFCDDFHALGLEGPDGYLDVLFHQDEDRSAAGAFSFASDKAQRRVCPCKSKLDPSPSVPAHWLIRRHSVVEMPRLEFLRALLIHHRSSANCTCTTGPPLKRFIVLDRLVL